MQQLKSGSLLQGGKYRIEKVLGQGGFGITYLATQELLDRKVCIKEFFFKEYCERDETTSHVTLGTQANRELVERFMNKFIKEARTISTLNHPHIIRIYDIFKENNTAYYVMEYIKGESLADLVKQRGALPENTAVEYIKQVASALQFVHQNSINHLDVKPANIMVRKEDNQAVLIDFGLSKQYDSFGDQTSTTPVGISHGYAPMEQYNIGGVCVFSPQTDIYSLGATLYKLVTCNTPPQAGMVLNDGLPELPNNVSSQTKEVIKKSMQPKKVERYNSIEEFVQQLNRKTKPVLHDKEETILIQTSNPSKQTESLLTCTDSKKTLNYSIALICSFALIVGIIIWGISVFTKDESSQMENSTIAVVEKDEQRKKDSIAVDRMQEVEKRKKDSIDALNEHARLAKIRKLEEEKKRKELEEQENLVKVQKMELERKQKKEIAKKEFLSNIKFVADAPKEVKKGELFKLSYTINITDIKDFRINRIDNFEVLEGPKISTINKTKTFTYVLKATKKGNFSFPIASIVINDIVIYSNTVNIIVKNDIWKYGAYELDKTKICEYLQSNAESYISYYGYNEKEKEQFISTLILIIDLIKNDQLSANGFNGFTDYSGKTEKNKITSEVFGYVHKVASEYGKKIINGTLE